MCLTADAMCLLTAPCHASSRSSSFSVGCPKLRCRRLTAAKVSCGTSAGHPGKITVEKVVGAVLGLSSSGALAGGCSLASKGSP